MLLRWILTSNGPTTVFLFSFFVFSFLFHNPVHWRALILSIIFPFQIQVLDILYSFTSYRVFWTLSSYSHWSSSLFTHYFSFYLASIIVFTKSSLTNKCQYTFPFCSLGYSKDFYLSQYFYKLYNKIFFTYNIRGKLPLLKLGVVG